MLSPPPSPSPFLVVVVHFWEEEGGKIFLISFCLHPQKVGGGDGINRFSNPPAEKKPSKDEERKSPSFAPSPPCGLGRGGRGGGRRSMQGRRKKIARVEEEEEWKALKLIRGRR